MASKRSFQRASQSRRRGRIGGSLDAHVGQTLGNKKGLHALLDRFPDDSRLVWCLGLQPHLERLSSYLDRLEAIDSGCVFNDRPERHGDDRHRFPSRPGKMRF